MRIREGDTVVPLDEGHIIAIVDRRRADGTIVCRMPGGGSERREFTRDQVRPLAELIAEARRSGEEDPRTGLSLVGGSKLRELASKFGHEASQRLRTDTLNRVLGQLRRAGLEVRPETDRWRGDDWFTVEIVHPGATAPATAIDSSNQAAGDGPHPSSAEALLRLPAPFWPRILGLPADREPAFLRALTLSDPLLCILHLPDGGTMPPWLRGVWEGLVSWSYMLAQRFVHAHSEEGYVAPRMVAGDAPLLDGFFNPTVLAADLPRLDPQPHALNLVTVKREQELPSEFERDRAIWPGALFEFGPVNPNSPPESAALIRFLLAAGGHVEGPDEQKWRDASPLKTLVWARAASASLLAQASVDFNRWASEEPELKRFKGSNESALALSLKARVAHWGKKFRGAHSIFEAGRSADGHGRVDIRLQGVGAFEVETLVGSGPAEAFAHEKVFSRVTGDEMFHLVVPADSLTWAGPMLADLASHLGTRGKILLPASDGSFMRIGPPQDSPSGIEPPDPGDLAERAVATSIPADPERYIKLTEIAGYESIKGFIQDEILDAARYGRLRGGSGILFFGPPGCGKSRLARVIAGELEREVRLLGPADLRGEYIGWGQRKIRQQFDWLADKPDRMLIIDEIDAVAQTRRQDASMHSDEKADVSELLVQLERATREGHIIVGTTNYLESLDEAIVRSGRFTLRVPVGPPNVNASVSIVKYYLGQLQKKYHDRVEGPQDDDIKDVLDQRLIPRSGSSGYLSAADLEDAVRRAHWSNVRPLLKGVHGTGNAGDSVGAIQVKITRDDLARAIDSGSRSVTHKSMEEFLDLVTDAELARTIKRDFDMGEK